MKKLCLLMAIVMVFATFCSCGGAKNNADLEGNTYVEGFSKGSDGATRSRSQRSCNCH